MKLLLCTECGDIIRLQRDEIRGCRCGSISGAYDDDGLNAWYAGHTALPLGIDNGSLRSAIGQQPDRGKGKRFSAFVIAKDCPTFRQGQFTERE